MIQQIELDRPKKPTEWTLMFYFASDNQLAPSIVSHLKAIKDAGFHPEANVVARFDPNTTQTPTHIFDVNLVNKLKAELKAKERDKVGFGSDPFVRSLIEDKLWGENDKDAQGKSIRQKVVDSLKGKDLDYDPPSLQETDEPDERQKAKETGDNRQKEPNPEKSLQTFLKFCSTNYPARHYILFILGHGIIVGNDIFLADEHVDDGAESLTLKKLGVLLQEFKTQIQATDSALELVSFHSCSVSGLEVAYELKDCANYMLASQGPAFVGSLPYRHILMRIFNDLNSSKFKAYDFKDAAGLAAKLKSGNDSVSSHLRGRLEACKIELPAKISESPADPEALEAFAKALNKFLDDQEMYHKEVFPSLSKPATHLANGSRDGLKLQRLNRRLLVEAYPDEIERIFVKRMLCKIFHYGMFNGFDFQLAGYSSDLCLTDLSKLSDREKPAIKASLDDLAKALMAGLPTTNNPEEKTLAETLILSSHLEAQSYWQENYTDLYDFCLSLQRACTKAGDDAEPAIKGIREACEKMIGLLKRGVDGDDNRLIVRSGCTGPTYQYSHGLSIFFPWTEPIESKMWDHEYGTYALMDSGKADDSKPSWKSFLDQYFRVTERVTRGDLNDANDGIKRLSATLDTDLLEEITGIVSSASGQLKAGPKDSTGKGGSKDPTGDDDCSCPTIKNYPRRTRSSPTLTNMSIY